MSKKTQPAPLRDYGAFGPDSIVWRIVTYPTSFTVAVQRTGAVEMLDPYTNAALVDTGSLNYRPAMRYQRTLQYTSTLIAGDSQMAVKAADMLMRIHKHIRGIEPQSKTPYDSLNPESQLWIHLTEWHSLLYCYETFSGKRLTKEEDEQYWAECRTAAIYQTIDPDTVPRNRAEATAYFDDMRPRLSGSENCQNIAQAILNIKGVNEQHGRVSKAIMWPLLKTMRPMTIATYPHWMRPVMGVRQGRIVDFAAIMTGRIVFNALAMAPKSMTAEVVRWLSPTTHSLVGGNLLGLEPENPVVVDPVDAWAAAGRPTPREQWLEMEPTRNQQTTTVKDDPSKLLSFH
jgi:uncharacterized protein (DUF2236 family)